MKTVALLQKACRIEYIRIEGGNIGNKHEHHQYAFDIWIMRGSSPEYSIYIN